MYLSKALFAALVSASLITSGAADDSNDCDQAPAVSHDLYGFPNRSPHFCWTRWKTGAVVVGMEVFATQFQVKGVTLTFSTGEVITGGEREGDRHDSIHWGAKSEIKAMKVANNAENDGLGLIHLEVDGKTLHVGSDIGSDEGQNVDVGAGLLLGHAGEAGAWLTAWSPLFLGVTGGTADITQIKFDETLDEVNKQQKGIQSMSVATSYIKNDNPVNATDADEAWTFNGGVQVQTSTSFSTTNENVFGLDVGVSAEADVGIPLIAEASVTVHADAKYEYHNVQTNQLSTSKTITVGQTQGSSATSDLLKPGHAKFCTTTVQQGAYDGGYTATIRISVQGKDFEIQRHGDFKGISYANDATECKDMLVIDIPGDASNVADAKTTGKRGVQFTA